MGQVIVQDLDDGVVESLKLKAALKGRSLAEELRAILTAAAPLAPDEKVALSDRLRSRCPPLPDFDVRAAIRHGRDDEHD